MSFLSESSTNEAPKSAINEHPMDLEISVTFLETIGEERRID